MKIRTLQPDDYERWKDVYAGYKQFYNVAVSESALRTTFDWIMDTNHLQHGVAIEDQGALAALANYQIHPNPLTAKYRMYINDIFVQPRHRNRGIGALLMEHLMVICKEQELESMRWMTAQDNATARALYDKYANVSAFITYEVKQ